MSYYLAMISNVGSLCWRKNLRSLTSATQRFSDLLDVFWFPWSDQIMILIPSQTLLFTGIVNLSKIGKLMKYKLERSTSYILQIINVVKVTTYEVKGNNVSSLYVIIINHTFNNSSFQKELHPERMHELNRRIHISVTNN